MLTLILISQHFLFDTLDDAESRHATADDGEPVCTADDVQSRRNEAAHDG